MRAKTVTVELLRSPRTIDNTIVAIGSHDMTLDLLADLLQRRHPTLRLSSSPRGQPQRAACPPAQRGAPGRQPPARRRDAASTTWATSSACWWSTGSTCVLLGFVNRTQGLIVPKGNPKGLETLEDLLRDDVIFVNRQRGAGTRVLLDYELKKRRSTRARFRATNAPNTRTCRWPRRSKSGAADTGLGILAAARALDLDFVPLFDERYDLVIPQEYYESALLQPLLSADPRPVIRFCRGRGSVRRLRHGADGAGAGRVLRRGEKRQLLMVNC